MAPPPAGTGKTDTAVQIMHILYHNCPSQRTLVVTHSNQALNDLFTKVGRGRDREQWGRWQATGWRLLQHAARSHSPLCLPACPHPQIVERDVPARYLLRLGMGEAELETELDFSRVGRVNAMLARRLELLAEVSEFVGAVCGGYSVWRLGGLVLLRAGGNLQQERYPTRATARLIDLPCVPPTVHCCCAAG